VPWGTVPTARTWPAREHAAATVFRARAQVRAAPQGRIRPARHPQECAEFVEVRCSADADAHPPVGGLHDDWKIQVGESTLVVLARTVPSRANAIRRDRRDRGIEELEIRRVLVSCQHLNIWIDREVKPELLQEAVEEDIVR